MKAVFVIVILFVVSVTHAQELTNKIQNAMDQLQLDAQLVHGIASLYVVDTKTGEIIFKKNEQTGLAPASCQKVVTSVTAFEILGKNFQYNTALFASGKIINGTLNGNLYLQSSGDPTFGSWRWNSTKETVVLDKFSSALKAKNIRSISGSVNILQKEWQQGIPDGWIWQDIGNYYGAPASGFNWRENQYDLVLKSGKKIGDSVAIKNVVPTLFDLNFKNEFTSASTGNGEDAYIYLPVAGSTALLRGTVGINKDNVTISGAIPDPANQFAKTFLKANNIVANYYAAGGSSQNLPADAVKIAEHLSPPLDSINYYFLKRSVNLYGEALVKTIAFKTSGYGSTTEGVEVIRKFWEKNGIEASALKMLDGSGLSPENRVTTFSFVKILTFARTKSWFNSFYEALPLINNIHMKSGHVSGVLSYSGYVSSKSGKEYTFSFIVNNFDGSTGGMKEKMWRVLDLLK